MDSPTRYLVRVGRFGDGWSLDIDALDIRTWAARVFDIEAVARKAVAERTGRAPDRCLFDWTFTKEPAHVC